MGKKTEGDEKKMLNWQLLARYMQDRIRLQVQYVGGDGSLIERTGLITEMIDRDALIIRVMHGAHQDRLIVVHVHRIVQITPLKAQEVWFAKERLV
ncbi:MAG: hypothetical protein BSOLF_2460 [Candidatus Carbobacillus altaicus]|uniref:Uncharacterized protein n=1 Tax=Candidatus Carbonibacillus altaicus TaxID=2163959 RepID=A0A2R6XY07_9BACL|nr:MAG: hypothetical protein BSOLF_2460 [Candidatus Carbobacillus altaicus]